MGQDSDKPSPVNLQPSVLFHNTSASKTQTKTSTPHFPRFPPFADPTMQLVELQLHLGRYCPRVRERLRAAFSLVGYESLRIWVCGEWRAEAGTSLPPGLAKLTLSSSSAFCSAATSCSRTLDRTSSSPPTEEAEG